MAVAYSGPRFGSAEASMKVSDDIVITPALPRFLAPGDSIAVPVSVMNTTSKNASVTLKIRTEGPLNVSSVSSQTIKVNANSEAQVYFGVTAQSATGKGKIIIETTAPAHSVDETEMAVRPISPLDRKSVV